MQQIECAGKDQLTPARAHELAQRLRRRGAASAYHCQFCGAWHVGGSPPSPLRRRKPAAPDGP